MNMSDDTRHKIAILIVILILIATPPVFFGQPKPNVQHFEEYEPVSATISDGSQYCTDNWETSSESILLYLADRRFTLATNGEITEVLKDISISKDEGPPLILNPGGMLDITAFDGSTAKIFSLLFCGPGDVRFSTAVG